MRVIEQFDNSMSVSTMMLRAFLIISCFVAFAYAQCGCSPSMISDENGLPKPDPETGLYEGDMELTSDNFLEMLGLRNVVSNTWPNRVLYYSVADGDAAAIDKALSALQSALSNCVRFEKRTSQSDYVEVYSGEGCSSAVGRSGGKQRLSLKRSGCYSTKTIQHEFIHALGFYHEQSRPDRDNNITINWKNISSTKCHNFYKKGSLPSGFPSYDYTSIMHYSSGSFSCNGSSTITTKSGGSVGGSALTSKDIAKIRAVYKC